MHIAFVFNRQHSSSIDEAEFDTPETVRAIREGIEQNGHQVTEIEMNRDGSWMRQLKQAAPDLIFNTTEGYRGVGRESLAPICFEQLELPYVGSGPYSCFLTLDKFLTKQVVQMHGVPVPEGVFVTDLKEFQSVAGEMTFPVFIKPNFEGSSKGITEQSLCRTKKEAATYLKTLLKQFPDGAIVERYIEGKDVTVPFIDGLGSDNGVLEPIEYVLTGGSGADNKGFIYDFALKNERDEDVGIRCPADISSGAREKIMKAMRQAVKALGVQDMARADFRVTPNGEVYFIELNALPSLQPGAGIFAAAEREGLNYSQTFGAIVQSALNRYKKRPGGGRSTRRIRTRDPRVALVYNLKRKHHDDADYENEAEFDSIETVNAIQAAIEANGYKVSKIEATPGLAGELIESEIDVVFNIAEGSNKRGREAQVPAVCDLIGIEHTGSDATCLAITLDKALTGKVLRAEGIRTPQSMVYTRPPKQLKHKLQFPVIVKPNLEGTSKGIYDNSVVHNDDELRAAITRLHESGSGSILCEEYIVGREFTIAVVGGSNLQVLGPLEIEFKNKENKFSVYSFEAKQAENQLDNDIFKMVCPANISEPVRRKVQKFAVKCFRAAGCRDIARIDFRLTPEEKPVFIEINPLPGLSPGFSDLTIMAQKLDWCYENLIGAIIKPAVRRWRRGAQNFTKRRK